VDSRLPWLSRLSSRCRWSTATWAGNDAVNGIADGFEAAVVLDQWEQTYTHFVGESLYCWPFSDTCLVASRVWALSHSRD